MIERLKGQLIALRPTLAILDCQGVGYGIEMPLTDLCRLPSIGSVIEVWIFTYVKEDALKLFGFLDQRQRRAFEILIALNGVGPKLAMAILSALGIKTLVTAVRNGSCETLELVPKVGRRMAERLIIDLKPKLALLECPFDQSPVVEDRLSLTPELDLASEESKHFADIQSALENLGFKGGRISEVLSILASQVQKDTDLQQLMKKALVLITKQGNPTAKTPLPPSIDTSLF